MREVELIIFDLDGTLVDSRKDIINAVNFTLKNIGLKTKSASEISSYVGTGVEDLIRKSLGGNQEALFKKALSVFENYYRQHSVDNTILYPNVVETLKYFRDKRKVIITNKRYELAILPLKALKIYGYFEDIKGGDDMDCMKPDSCPLDRMMRGFKIEDKTRAIIVGDMDIDVLAGKNAGIMTCAVTYGIGKKEDILKAKPDYIIDDILQLKEIID